VKHQKYIVEITQDGNKACALIGSDLMVGIAGFGDTLTEALRDLANELDKGDYHTVNSLSLIVKSEG
jgi:flagellar basal body P-ring protein FlgI